LLLPACKSSEAQAEGEMEAAITVRVYNSNALDVTVYAIRNATRYRLGQVGTTRTKHFTMPTYLITGNPLIRFEADPIGSAVSIFIDEFAITPGEEVNLTVPSYNRQ
jgi:hypothetical protein